MQVVNITIDGIVERMLLEFQGDFLSLNLELGQLTIDGDSASFRCGNQYLGGRVIELQAPYYVLEKRHTSEQN